MGTSIVAGPFPDTATCVNWCGVFFTEPSMELDTKTRSNTPAHVMLWEELPVVGDPVPAALVVTA
jgi:hypothetical protein